MTEIVDDKKDEKKQGSKIDGYVLVVLALLLWVIGGHFNNSPLPGQHKLLAATSAVTMKELKGAVIFVTSHTRQGAHGIILNRPGKKGASGDGGPMEKGKVYALHSLEVRLPETQVLKEADIGLVEGREAVERLKSAKTKPSWYIVVNGYAGWAQGQLEQELKDGAWELLDFDKKVVTETPPAKLLEAAKKLPQIQITH